jgi:transcriptional regulator with XRE-family HTH domain
MDIGSAIRAIRKRKNITIPQLCDGTGLSKGFISNVENNKTSPSIATLNTIAQFFNVPLAYFLLEQENRMRVVRQSDRGKRNVPVGEHLVRMEEVSSLGGLTLIISTMPSGASSGEKPHAHEGIESHIVLKGKALAVQGDVEEILHEGDSFSWKSCGPHLVTNIGDEDLVLLIARYTEEKETF